MEYLIARGNALRLPLSDMSVDLCFGSPPYCDCRLYLENGVDLGISRGCAGWVEWMLAVTAECLRVSRGAVVWVASGVTRDRTYWPACEGLMWEWFKGGGSAYRPCYWHRVGIPGSGGDQWFRADVEYVMAFKRDGKLPWSDPTAMGHAPKLAPGGEMSNRMHDGKRVNAFGVRTDGVRIGGRRQNGGLARDESPAGNAPDRAVPVKVRETLKPDQETVWKRIFHKPDGTAEVQAYVPPVKVNPGTLVRTKAGGHMGSDMAHENEAPFPESLAEHFVRSLCPPGGTVLDPFSGSGTTAAVAARLDRRGIGIDLRQSQCKLAARRVAAGLRPVSKLDPKPVAPLFGQQTLFGD